MPEPALPAVPPARAADAAAAPACPNCGADAPGRFCGDCGQERRTLHVPFGRLVGEAVEETLALDSRVAHTLAPLFLRPGEVTRAYLDGRRARYTSPIRLYLFLSFVFFLVSALGAGRSRIVLGGHDAREHPVELPDKDLAALRGLGPLGARAADRFEVLAREPPERLQERVVGGFLQNAPRALFVLLPLLAVLLRLAWRRSGLFLAEHLVVSLHAHAVAFALLLPGAALGHGGLQAIGLAAAAGHLVLAARRVYGGGALATVLRGIVVVTLYGLALALSLAVAAVVALATA